jgi:hypothetical protein
MPFRRKIRMGSGKVIVTSEDSLIGTVWATLTFVYIRDPSFPGMSYSDISRLRFESFFLHIGQLFQQRYQARTCPCSIGLSKKKRS